MQRQVIGTGEAALAHLAAERLGARVFAVVARQLVGARETPLTFRPMASVRLFACQKNKKQIAPHFISALVNLAFDMQMRCKSAETLKRFDKFNVKSVENLWMRLIISFEYSNSDDAADHFFPIFKLWPMESVRPAINSMTNDRCHGDEQKKNVDICTKVIASFVEPSPRNLIFDCQGLLSCSTPLSTRLSIIINQTLNNAAARAETQYFPSRLTSTSSFLRLFDSLSPMMRAFAGNSAVFRLQFRLHRRRQFPSSRNFNTKFRGFSRRFVQPDERNRQVSTFPRKTLVLAIKFR